MHNSYERWDDYANSGRQQDVSPVNMSDPSEVSAAFPRHGEKHHHHHHHHHHDQGQGNSSLDFGNDIYGCASDNRSLTAAGDVPQLSQSANGSQFSRDAALANVINELETLVERLEQDLLGYENSGDHTSCPPSGDTPAQPATPAQPGDAPAQPATPAQPGDSPTQPATPAQPGDAPTQPATPAQPVNNTPSPGPSPAPADSQTLTDIKNQNDRSHATVYLDGDTPEANGYNATATPGAPENAGGITAWGIVGNELGANVDRSATVQVKNMQTYVHHKGGGWELVENQNDPQSNIAGMTEGIDFTNVQQMNVDNAGGVASMAAPLGARQMDHFGVNKNWTPGSFEAGSIDGVFERADIKASENNSGLVAKLGGEFWSAPGQADNTIVGIPGTNNFTRLTDQYQTMYFTNVSSDVLDKDPPPGTVSDQPTPATPAGGNGGGNPAAPAPGDGGGGGGNAGDSGQKLMIPFPTDSQWAEINNNPSIPKGSLVIPIYSGDNSKPDSFDSFGPNLKAEITTAEQNGLVPIGYVGTAAGTKPLDEVEKEIDAWYANAPVEGIYLGASGKSDLSGYATDPASEAYFKEIADYIHAKHGIAVINGRAGSYGSVNPDYLNSFDVQNMGEAFQSSLNQIDSQPSWMDSVPSDKLSAFVSGVSAADMQTVADKLKQHHAGYVWITDVDYGSSPEYLQNEINTIAY